MTPADESRLAKWLAERVEGVSAPVVFARFAGGQSNPTWRARAGVRDIVVRCQPAGQLKQSAHAVDREFRVLSALHGVGYPVPRPLALCEDPDVIGASFYAMEMVEGRIFWNTAIPGVSATDRAACFAAMNAGIADLHALDVDALGLTDFGRGDAYMQRQIARWTRQYRSDESAGRVPAMDELADWLPQHIPPGDERALVHGDFRCDNLIFHPTEPRIAAVIDWELSTIGHPLADFTYHLMMYLLPAEGAGVAGLADADLAALNIPTMDAYIELYCRLAGRSDLPSLDFFAAFNLFRMAAIAHGIRGRLARGNASSAKAAEIARCVEPLAALAARSAARC